MGTSNLAGRRILVVGASSGIGRATAVKAVQAGADVVLVARRDDLLKEAIAEAGGGTPLVADLQKPDDCTRIAQEAAGALGTVDLVVFAAGMAPLRRVEQTSPEQWATTMATNVISLNLIVPALLPALAPRAIVAALSSEAVDHARWGLSAYGASKSALEATLRSWRIEHPEIRFSAIGVGSTVPTDFGSNFDGETLVEALGIWAKQGLAQAEFMSTDDVADVLLGILAAALPFPGVGLEHVVVRSPAGVVGDTDLMMEAAADIVAPS